MANDLTTTDQRGAPATGSSTPALTESMRAVLDRAFDQTTRFTAAEIALIEPIAASVPAVWPVDERTVRQSIGTLSAALPAQATNEAAGKLKLGAYMTMLAGCDERALAYASRRCLAELDWFPTVHQLMERINHWVSPDQAAVSRARAILRTGRRAVEDDGGDVSADEMRQLRERTTLAAASLRDRRPQAVAYDTPVLEPHQIRIPNKDDIQRLFGIDPEAELAKAAKQQRDDEWWDVDLLAASVDLYRDKYRVTPEMMRAA